MPPLELRCDKIPARLKATLRLMLLARHARAGGGSHAVDGNHAVYHHELRTTLEHIGLAVLPADDFEAVQRTPDADFVIPLLNRAGFEHSEMLAPLQLTRHRIPFLGASPMLRGLADDKHLFKLVARARGVPTPDWCVHRRGGACIGSLPGDPPWIVKPNASSASWGVRVFEDERGLHAHVSDLWQEGHDVIVEQWVPSMDVAVPVIGAADGAPWLLPAMLYLPEDGRQLRSYEEKRGLVPTGDDPLVRVEDRALATRLEELTRPLVAELWPFDYGRFEFRYDLASGALSFMEVNLSCNLWSKKTISRSAGTLGISHPQLVEAIVAHSLRRQGVIAGEQGLAVRKQGVAA